MTTEAAGDLWTYGCDLGGLLRQRGHAVTLAVLGPGLDAAQAAEAARQGVEAVELGHPSDRQAASAAEIAAAARAVASLAGRRAADILHLNHPAMIPRRSRLAVAAFSHGCAATWWAAVHGGALPPETRWRATLTERGLAAAAVRVAPSSTLAEATRSAYGFGEAPLVVRPGRAPVAVLAPREAPAVSVLACGLLWDEAQNIMALDRAALRLPVPVLAAGPLAGPGGAAVTLHHIRALGILAETGLRATLAARPIFVSTALYDPFGLAIIDAAQAGCALVLADIAGYRESWDGAALFVPAVNDAMIATAIRRLLDDPALRAELGESARRRAENLSLQACAEGTERAYAAARLSAGKPQRGII